MASKQPEDLFCLSIPPDEAPPLSVSLNFHIFPPLFHPPSMKHFECRLPSAGIRWGRGSSPEQENRLDGGKKLIDFVLASMRIRLYEGGLYGATAQSRGMFAHDDEDKSS